MIPLYWLSHIAFRSHWHENLPNIGQPDLTCSAHVVLPSPFLTSLSTIPVTPLWLYSLIWNLWPGAPQVCSCNKAFAFANFSVWISFPQMPTWHAPEFLSGFCSNVTLSVKLLWTSLGKHQHPWLCYPYPFARLLLPCSTYFSYLIYHVFLYIPSTSKNHVFFLNS